jgi:hypothetical protein
MRRLTIAAAFIVASVGLLASFGGVAAADTIIPNPITFESSQGYVLGNIDGQQGWSNAGGYDAAVANVASFSAASTYGFDAQALRLSDAVTSDSFGDQTFSPGLTQPAGETSAQTHFGASFKIGTTLATEQTGLHMSVSPDSGSGGRMSYLRFEDQATGVHVFFDDVTDPGPFYTQATFNESDIATLSRASAHTIRFSITFVPGPGNDIVNIYIDGSLVKTGTTWEDYYRYDNENQVSAAPVPTVSKLLFRESGTADTTHAGGGFLVDAVSLTSSASAICTPTGLVRDGIDLTAAQIGGNVTGNLDATGCNIGVYYGPGTTGSVSGANISGANYYGVVANAAAVNVANTSIHDIGETPLNGSQHGVGVLYTTINQDGLTTGPAATGTLSRTTITNYQKNGVVVSGNGAAVKLLTNTVTGQGPVNYIAQNGIQISFGATAQLVGNTVSLNSYTPPKVTACGLLIYKAGGVSGVSKSGISFIKDDNTITNNETDICNFGKGGGFSPAP